MTSKEFRKALRKLGLSRREMSRLLGVGERTVSNWVGGQHVTNIPAAILITLLEYGEVTINQIRNTCQSPHSFLNEAEIDDVYRRLSRGPVTIAGSFRSVPSSRKVRKAR